MTEKDIKPIPKYILEKYGVRINNAAPSKRDIFGSMPILPSGHKELVKITR